MLVSAADTHSLPQPKQLPPDGRGSATYLITFSCYGQHLHGDERGSVDRLHNQPGSRFLAVDEPRYETETALMKEQPYHLDARAREVVLGSIKEVCEHRGWIIGACHVRTTHVHALVTSEAKVGKVMNDLKAYASRGLNKLGEKRERRWARHGSARRLSGREQVVKATRYVIEGQGKPMAVWPEPRSLEPRA